LSWPIVWDGNRADSSNAPHSAETRRPSDEEVMLSLQANNANALDFLFHRYSRPVLGLAFRVLRDYGEAEEIVQEAFFQVFQKATLFDPSKGTAKAWILQIALHRALDRKSFLDRRGFYLAKDIDCMDDILPSETDLDRELGAKFDRVQLEKAFEQLPDMQRRTLELFYFEGFQLCEVVEKLNEPLGNIRHHFYRGLERLRKSAFVQQLREK
jgi:RNA polymerase sigma-70 factor (ECF subfamily)